MAEAVVGAPVLVLTLPTLNTWQSSIAYSALEACTSDSNQRGDKTSTLHVCCVPRDHWYATNVGSLQSARLDRPSGSSPCSDHTSGPYDAAVLLPTSHRALRPAARPASCLAGRFSIYY